MRRGWILLALLAPGCDDDDASVGDAAVADVATADTAPDAGPDAARDVPTADAAPVVDGPLPDLPIAEPDARPPPADLGPPDHLPRDCFGCHDRERLEGTKGPEDGSLLAFYLQANAGLKLAQPLLPGQGDPYFLDLPDRGRHPPGLEPDDCWPCHRIEADGTGHGARTGPGDPFEPATDCAEACHAWIGDAVEQAGPAGTSWSGSLRPAALLMEGNAHSALWAGGYVRPEGTTDIIVSEVGPGCGGCHAVDTPSHGASPSCLRCHAWGGVGVPDGAHARHLGYIGGAEAEGVETACGWCHGFAAEGGVARPACYNCHLSAHAPSAGGYAQLGP